MSYFSYSSRQHEIFESLEFVAVNSYRDIYNGDVDEQKQFIFDVMEALRAVIDNA